MARSNWRNEIEGRLQQILMETVLHVPAHMKANCRFGANGGMLVSQSEDGGYLIVHLVRVREHYPEFTLLVGKVGTDFPHMERIQAFRASVAHLAIAA